MCVYVGECVILYRVVVCVCVCVRGAVGERSGVRKKRKKKKEKTAVGEWCLYVDKGQSWFAVVVPLEVEAPNSKQRGKASFPCGSGL